MQLHEKHRPKALSEIVGQEKAVKTVSRLVDRGIGGRALYITGQSGTGKTTIAKILADTVADKIDIVEVVGRELTTGTLRSITDKR